LIYKLFALLAVVFLSTAAFSQDAALPYQLGSGDQIRVTVFGEQDLSGEFEIDGTGNISLPLIGSVTIGSKNISDAEASIVTLLADGYLVSPRVNIEVLNYRPFYILGEVASPGSYPYVSGMTILNAIALASGFTHRAQKKRVEITRKQDGVEVKTTVEVTAIVQPGDIIRVSERFF
jgi:protein involved in polysaccharide export with SLBB domain